jgi:hypothetical protein
MQFADFAELHPNAVASIVAEKTPQKLGIGIPFNGTRRWYLATANRQAGDLYGPDYIVQVRQRMHEIIQMIFADGIKAIYTPLIGQSLAARGAAYMTFAAKTVGALADDESIHWYCAQNIRASCYGEVVQLPADVQLRISHMTQATQHGSSYLRYGTFADRPQPDLISRTVELYRRSSVPPTEEQLAEDYYGGPFVKMGMWIGSDQPTLFDVPLVFGENTALYFLQFPTLYLDQQTWRRLLYDYLFVRGDEESLYPENLTSERRITGLGTRQNGYWLPTTT